MIIYGDIVVIVVDYPAGASFLTGGRRRQVGAGPEREDQRKEESTENSKPGQVVPTGPAQRVGSSGKDIGRGVWWCEGLSRRRD